MGLRVGTPASEIGKSATIVVPSRKTSSRSSGSSRTTPSQPGATATPSTYDSVITRKSGAKEYYKDGKLVRETDPTGIDVIRVELERRAPSAGGGVKSTVSSGKTSTELAKMKAISQLQQAQTFEQAKRAATRLASLDIGRATTEIKRFNVEQQRKLEREISRDKAEAERQRAEQTKSEFERLFASRQPSGIFTRTLPKDEKKTLKELEGKLVIPERMPRISKVPQLELDVIRGAVESRSGIKQLEVQARELGDKKLSDAILKSKKKGRLTDDEKQRYTQLIKEKTEKREIAVAKINQIIKKLDERNENYDRAAKAFLDKTALLLQFKETSGRTEGQRKAARIAKEYAITLSKYVNPFIVGDQLGGALEIFRTAKVGGLINPKEAIKKAGETTVKASAGVIKDIAKGDIKSLKDKSAKTLKAIEKFSKYTIKTLQNKAKTEKGLAELLAVATIIGIPQKLVKEGLKITSKGIKVSPKFYQEFTKLNKALWKSKAAKARFSGRLSKGELKKQSAGVKSTRKFLSKAEKTASRKEATKQIQQFQFQKFIAEKGVVIKKPIKIISKPTAPAPKSLDILKTVDMGKGLKLVKAVKKTPKKQVTQLITKPRSRVKTPKQIRESLSRQNQQISVVEKTLSKGGGREKAKAKLLEALRRKSEALQAERVTQLKLKKQKLKLTDKPATGKEKLIIPEEEYFDPTLKGYIDKYFQVQDLLPAGASSGFFRNLKKAKPSLDAKVKLAIDNASKQLDKFQKISLPDFKIKIKPEVKGLPIVTFSPIQKPKQEIGVSQVQKVSIKAEQKPQIISLQVLDVDLKPVTKPKPKIVKKPKPKQVTKPQLVEKPKVILKKPPVPKDKVIIKKLISKLRKDKTTKKPKLLLIPKLDSKPTKVKKMVTPPKPTVTGYTPTLFEFTKRVKKKEKLLKSRIKKDKRQIVFTGFEVRT